MSQDRIAKLIRPEIAALSAYHVPPARGLIKLDAMENPYRWPPEMVDAWLATLRDAEINRYPDPAAGALKDKLRTAMDVPAGMDILLGNGSDEIIQMLAMALARPGAGILAPEPSFVMYRMIATLCGMDYTGVPLAADFALDLPATLAAIERQRPALLFIAYPNNPTGNLFARADVEAVIQAAPGLVVIDEAYAPFAGGESFMADLGRFDNLVVMRTVSKMGLAGLRLGLLAGSAEWLSEFDKLRLPYNINVLTQATAEFALEYGDMFEEQAAAICAERAALFDALTGLEGVEAFRSDANFILFRTPPGRAAELHAAMRERGVLVKNIGATDGPLADCLRVTVALPAENAAFLAALKAAL